ncbi:hypothetical protein KSC_011850 [Ktedonobacter sp. SOSP1-52]|uniref:hypothetical protein n=1 Tax=Ktedonobacter sp. SOSP1-52 TaxID=2778366 RepID=UPI001914FE6B|nr:hypothetical protein [Ktedonobacter sp. SOSP1-52]GHO62293.1 hypothetical protein KSC_011850 [Ktedonobacter sp. SOSP1-52]
MIAVQITRWVASIIGLGALLLGLAFWLFHIDLLNVHMLFGFIVTLSLLGLGIAMLFSRGLRLLGIISIIYAPILPVFGMTQDTLLIGDLHWLIRVAHMLVGIGALVLIGLIGARYQALKRNSSNPTLKASLSSEKG